MEQQTNRALDERLERKVVLLQRNIDDGFFFTALAFVALFIVGGIFTAACGSATAKAGDRRSDLLSLFFNLTHLPVAEWDRVSKLTGNALLEEWYKLTTNAATAADAKAEAPIVSRGCLGVGSVLETGTCHAADKGYFQLCMQRDGNLVLSRTWTDIIYWESGTKGVGLYAAIQEDGNVVLYARDGKPIWSAGSFVPGGKFNGLQLCLHDDTGDLVLRREKSDKPLWHIKGPGTMAATYHANKEEVHGRDCGKGERSPSTNAVATNAVDTEGHYFWLIGSAAVFVDAVGVGGGGTTAKKEEETKGWAKDYAYHGSEVKTVMASGTYMRAGDCTLRSPSGEFTLCMRRDRNLVIYGRKWTLHMESSTRSEGKLLDDYAFRFDKDGTFAILYDTTSERKLWVNVYGTGYYWRRQHGEAGDVELVLTDEGYLSVREVAPPPPVAVQQGVMRPGSTLYAGDCNSLQSANGYYRLCVQRDGNLVLYDAANNPYWATDTGQIEWERASFNHHFRLTLQHDGNLVLYDGDDDSHVIWATGTSGVQDLRLFIDNEGRLRFKRPDGVMGIWESPPHPDAKLVERQGTCFFHTTVYKRFSCCMDRGFSFLGALGGVLF